MLTVQDQAVIPTEVILIDPINSPVSTSITANQNLRIDAKLEILQAFERFRDEVCTVESLKVLDCYGEFDKRYQRGEIQVPDEVRKQYPRASRSTLIYWQSVLKTRGINALAGNYGNRKGHKKIDLNPQLHDFVVGMLIQNPHCSATHVWRGLKARFAEEELPTKETVQRWIKAWKDKHQEVFTALSNPDEWKSKYMVAFGSQSEGIEQLNQLWELDSTPSDLLLEDGRYSLIGGIDVYSRQVKLEVSKTSKATAIAALLRRLLLDWGVPEEVKTDNGKDYTSNHLKRVFAGLNIKHTPCPLFQPWHKPHIERFFRTFAHDLVELLPGYIGHNVAERKAIESRKSFAERLMKRNETIELRITAVKLQEFCDKWCDGYLHKKHEGLGGKAPFQVFSESREPVRRIGDERALDILLAEAPSNGGMRTVQKQGIQLNSDWFVAPELEAYIRQQVKVLYDPVELGKIYVFGGGGFICVAECSRLTGINRQEVALKAKELQKKRVQEVRKTLKQIARTAKTDEIVDEILTQEQKAAAKLVPFPQLMEIYDTESLRAAGDAALAMKPPKPQPHISVEEHRAVLTQRFCCPLHDAPRRAGYAPGFGRRPRRAKALLILAS